MPLQMKKSTIIVLAIPKGSAYPEAKYFLACAYYQGDGVEKDEAKALQLIKEAAAQDYLPAVNILKDISAKEQLNK